MLLSQVFPAVERCSLTGNAEAHYSPTVEAHYHQIYYEVLDLANSTVKARFDQPGYATYKQSEELLLKSAHGEDYSAELTSVTDFYGNDFDRRRLSAQLTSLASQFEAEAEP